jgi:hypothetical protein
LEYGINRNYVPSLKLGRRIRSQALMIVASSAESPFHAIWMPMHKRMKAITRRIP